MIAAQVNIGINIGTPPPPPPPIVITAPPQLVVIPGMPVSYAPAIPYNYFFYGGQYYVFHEGAWFTAPGHHGPWTFVAVERVPRPLLRVPVTYYKVPPGRGGMARDTNTTSTTTMTTKPLDSLSTQSIDCVPKHQLIALQHACCP